MIRVGGDVVHPTHDMSLTDRRGRTAGLIFCDSNGRRDPYAIARAASPRTALKMATGTQKYADFEPPWSPIAQENWAGGMLREDFDSDTTTYRDGYRANTMYGYITNAPLEKYVSGYRSQNMKAVGSGITWKGLLGSQRYVAVRFTASASYQAKYIYVHLRRVGTPSSLTLALCANSGSEPSTVLASTTITTTDISDTVSVFYRSEITATSLTSGTLYWIRVSAASTDDDDNHWKVGVEASAGETKTSSSGSSWTLADFDMYYRCTDADSLKNVKFFRYKGALYVVAGSTPKVYINGDRGAASDNSSDLTKLIDTTKSWTTNSLVGNVVLLVEGPGSEEANPARVITANTSTTLTVSPAWEQVHTTSTAYVILGMDTLTEISSTGLTKPVTDVLVVNGICYFCQGSGSSGGNIRRMQWTAASGYQWADDGTNKADYLCLVSSSTGDAIWRADNSYSSTSRAVSYASVVGWGTNLTFTGTIEMKDDDGRINKIIQYGDTPTLWILREGMVYYVSGSRALPIELTSLRTMEDSRNGIAAMVHNVYLYFNLGYGIERYYNKTMDDMGVNRDAGLPQSRQGVVCKMVSYPDRFYAMIDAGSGTSSVVGHNGNGWCEIYRAPAAGMSALDMEYQTIPGDTPDRLWLAIGGDILYLYQPSKTVEPGKDANFRYTHEGVVESGWMYLGMYDVYKTYSGLKVFAENLEEGKCWVEADYKVDNETEWTPVTDKFYTSPMSEVKLTDDFGVTGKRIAIRLRLYTTSASTCPKVKAMVVEAISRVPVKYSFTLPFRTVDCDIERNGNPESLTAEEKGRLIDTWAETLEPLVMRTNLKRYDKKRVFIDPTVNKPLYEKKEGYLETLTVVEV